MDFDSDIYDKFKKTSESPLKQSKKTFLPGKIIERNRARILVSRQEYSHPISLPSLPFFKNACACSLELLYGIREKKGSKLAASGIKDLHDAARNPLYKKEASTALNSINNGFNSVKTLLKSRFPASHKLSFLMLSYFNKEDFLYVDIETLSLDVNSPVIMIGAGYFTGDKYFVDQYTALDYASEYEMLEEFKKLLPGKKAFVTFNGRSFDIPFIDARIGYYGGASGLTAMHNFDLLHFSKKAYRGQTDSYRLKQVERMLKIKDRDDDIDGSEVGYYYNKFVATRDPSYITPIIHHNKEDIESLLLISNKLVEKWGK